MDDDLLVQTKRRHYTISTNISDDDDDDDDEDATYEYSSSDQYKLISGTIAGGSNTMTHHWPVHRHSKRYTSWIIIAAACLFILMLMYIPLSNHVNQQRIVPISGWDRNTTRDTSFYILPHVNTTLIDPVHICQSKLFLLIVVCSSTVNFELRQSIRETWGNITEFNYSKFVKIHQHMKGKYLDINYKNWRNYMFTLKENEISHDLHNASQQNFLVKVVFLVGQTVDNETQNRIFNESENNGDVIQESFIDSYNNLTLKTIMMLKWAMNDNCSQKVKYLMKCDDDTFVNVPNLLHVLLGGTVPVYNATVQDHDQITVKATSSTNRLTQQNKLLVGLRFCNSKPIANVSSKWYTPMYMYDGNIYPNYLSGTGYVMSMDVATKLYNASLTTPFFHLEDVYLTGICAKAAKIKPLNHQLFSYTSYQKLCELKGMITKHELTAMKMHQAYDFVRNTSAVCAKPDKYYRVRKVKSRDRFCS